MVGVFTGKVGGRFWFTRVGEFRCGVVAKGVMHEHHGVVRCAWCIAGVVSRRCHKAASFVVPQGMWVHIVSRIRCHVFFCCWGHVQRWRRSGSDMPETLDVVFFCSGVLRACRRHCHSGMPELGGSGRPETLDADFLAVEVACVLPTL